MGVIYKISNLLDDRVYIGSTVDYNRRHREHINDLKNGNHHNIHLQRFFNKYGLDKLVFNIIEECDNNFLKETEQKYLNTGINLFNISKYASAPMMGRNHSKTFKEKMSNIMKGKNNPMYGKKRPKWIIDKWVKSKIRKKEDRTKQENILSRISRKKRTELIIEKGEHKIRCMSQSHAAKIIGVKHQSIGSCISRGTFKCKGWSIIICEDQKYTKQFVLKYINLFDDDMFPQKELLDMLMSL